jgi:predicted phage terminase large subunit-like protein
LVGAKCAYDPETEDFIVEHCFRDQLGPGKIEEKVKYYAELDGFDCDIGIEQEPGSAGKILVEHYKNNVLPDYKVEALPVSKAKVVRAQPFLAAAEDGHVYLLEDITWNQAFRDEFETFPPSNKGIHDDMIDPTAFAYSKLTGKKSLSVSWGRPAPVGPSTNRRSGTKNSQTSMNEQARFASLSVGERIKGATWGR